MLGGLSRVRAISLNDSHNFCALEQVGEEVRDILRLIHQAHAALGVRPAGFRLSLRGPGEKYVGDDARWARADALAADALAGGLRVEVERAGSLGARIRDAARRRVPYVGVVGPREAAAGAVSLRLRGGRGLDPMPAADAVALIRGVVGSRSHVPLP